MNNTNRIIEVDDVNLGFHLTNTLFLIPYEDYDFHGCIRVYKLDKMTLIRANHIIGFPSQLFIKN
jgi:hypothetical protein